MTGLHRMDGAEITSADILRARGITPVINVAPVRTGMVIDLRTALGRFVPPLDDENSINDDWLTALDRVRWLVVGQETVAAYRLDIAALCQRLDEVEVERDKLAAEVSVLRDL